MLFKSQGANEKPESGYYQAKIMPQGNIDRCIIALTILMGNKGGKMKSSDALFAAIRQREQDLVP